MTSPPRRNTAIAVVVMHAGMMLLVQRKDGETPRNYWELPYGYPGPSETLADAAVSVLLASANLTAEFPKRMGIFDKPEATSDLVVVYGAQMNHHATASAGSPDIIRVTWALPGELPEMAPGHADMMFIYLHNQYG